ncbi:hypothetical protein K438DRAFT_1823078 [Mycena galopus ATCC 62051]|nr:hypothetical protein K438DRAFT_1823078 [Mycena galopus ATCC 62051]
MASVASHVSAHPAQKLATTLLPDVDLEPGTLPQTAIPIYGLRCCDIEYRVHTLFHDYQSFCYTFSPSYGKRNPLRLLLYGEINSISSCAEGTQNLLLGCPRNTTPAAKATHIYALKVLAGIIDSEPKKLVDIATHWTVDGRAGDSGLIRVQTTSYTKISPNLSSGVAVSLEVTLHQYDHYVEGTIQREYNLIAHNVEPLPHSQCLVHPGYISDQAAAHVSTIDDLQASLLARLSKLVVSRRQTLQPNDLVPRSVEVCY